MSPLIPVRPHRRIQRGRILRVPSIPVAPLIGGCRQEGAPELNRGRRLRTAI